MSVDSVVVVSLSMLEMAGNPDYDQKMSVSVLEMVDVDILFATFDTNE